MEFGVDDFFHLPVTPKIAFCFSNLALLPLLSILHQHVQALNLIAQSLTILSGLYHINSSASDAAIWHGDDLRVIIAMNVQINELNGIHWILISPFLSYAFCK